MTKKSLYNVVRNLMFENSEIESGYFTFKGVYGGGFGFIRVTDHKHLEHNDSYVYFDREENRMRSTEAVTNTIWSEWNIKDAA